MKPLHLSILWALIYLSHSPTRAEQGAEPKNGPTKNSTVTLDLGTDSNSTTNRNLGFSHNFLDFSVYASAGSTKSKNDSNEALSRAFAIGIKSKSSNQFSIGGEISSWGLKDELLHNTFSIPTDFNTDTWGFGFTPGLGNLRFMNIGAQSREKTVSANQLGLALNYFGFDRIILGIGITKYWYGEDLTNFSNDRFAQFFTESALSLTQSLADQKSYMDGQYLFETFDLGLRLGRTKSAVDESITVYNELYGSVDCAEDLSLTLTLGSGKITDYGLVPASNRDDDQFTYGSIGIGYKF